mmetsp:Transcript_8831/g.8912  ORF Transcript_8831/g.8912 Transcript_8831/m.8912 type:complete len:109 (-) Transcript_8831:717-1043(-)
MFIKNVQKQYTKYSKSVPFSSVHSFLSFSIPIEDEFRDACPFQQTEEGTAYPESSRGNWTTKIAEKHDASPIRGVVVEHGVCVRIIEEHALTRLPVVPPGLVDLPRLC